MMDWDSFFTVHKGLAREGPGCDADVDWACALAKIAPEARIVDVGCGVGGDTAALSRFVPQGNVLGVDITEPFINEASARHAARPKTRFEVYDMAKLPEHPHAPFDFIWCAGALYFLGLEKGLATLSAALRPGGAIAFSEPCLFTPGHAAEAASLFEDYPLQDAEAIALRVEEAGLDVLGQRNLSDAAWEDYYKPMEKRIAALRPDADARLSEMLDMCAEEAAIWRRVKDHAGYILTVARKR